MEFLVEFEINVPGGTPQSEVRDREDAEATAAAQLAREGHLVRVWKLTPQPAKPRCLACTTPTAERNSTRCSALCRSTSGCV